MLLLIVLVSLVLALAHWLLAPFTDWLTPLVQWQPLPWLLLLLGAWLLAGRRADSR